MLFRNRTKTHDVIYELLETRLAWKMGIREVARRANIVDHTFLRETELGNHDIRFRNMVKWADALGYEIVLRPKEV